jgi:hypothetical protein
MRLRNRPHAKIVPAQFHLSRSRERLNYLSDYEGYTEDRNSWAVAWTRFRLPLFLFWLLGRRV